jgi:hypothetical protein
LGRGRDVRRGWVQWLLVVVVVGGLLGCDGSHEKGKRKDLDMPKPSDAKEK